MSYADILIQLQKFDIMRLRNCEICGPIIKGYKGNYPICKRHKEIWDELQD
jgi:hypothetical protein